MNPENMKYVIETKNSTYTLVPVNGNPDVMKITSGNYSGLEILKPSQIPNVGDNFNFIFSNNPVNGRLIGRMMSTSAVQSPVRIEEIQPNAVHMSIDDEYVVGENFPVSHPKQLSMDTVKPVRPMMQGIIPNNERISTKTHHMSMNGPLVDDGYVVSEEFASSNPDLFKQLSSDESKPVTVLPTKDFEQLNIPDMSETKSNVSNEMMRYTAQQNTKIKNPFALAVALAKNKLARNFHTSYSTYTLTPVTGNDSVMMLSGGAVPYPLEVVKPSTMPQVGDKLILSYTDNPSNGIFAGKQFKSSSVKDKSFTDTNGNNYSANEVSGKYNAPTKQISSIGVATGHSVYTLSAIPGKRDVMMLSGGKVPFPLEVYKPQDFPQLGDTLDLVYTSNPNNGNFANKRFSSSRIEDVMVDSSQIQNASVSFSDNLRGAGKFKVSYPNWFTKDFGSELQSKMSDIANRASEILGLPDGQKQELYFTPSNMEGPNAEFQVGFNGFPINTNGINAVRQSINEELASNGCAKVNFGPVEPVGRQEFGMMREALSETALNLDRQNMIMKAIADMEKNTAESRNELRSALSTPYISENVKSNNGMQFQC